jgi:hypothetical protein
MTSCSRATSTEEDDLLLAGSRAAIRRGQRLRIWLWALPPHRSSSTRTYSSYSPPRGPASAQVHLSQDDGVAHGELEASVARGSGASLVRSPGESPALGR